MARTIRMSTIIRKARDEHLWPGDNISQVGNIFSCHAIEDAILNMLIYYAADDIVFDKLKDYGCDIYSGKLFDEFKTDELRQGARFLWLSFMIEATKNVKIKL